MTPLGIEIMLHYHTRTNDYRDGDFSAPAVKSTLESFQEEGLLSKASKKFIITNKGRFYVEYLCSVPLPRVIFSISPPTIGEDGG